MTGRALRVYLGLLVASLLSVVSSLVWVLAPGSDDIRVIEDALRGGVTLAVDALNAAADREATRAELEARFGYPVTLLPAAPLDRRVQFELDEAEQGFVFAGLADGERMRLGPLPDYALPVDRFGVALLALALSWAVVAVVLVRPQLRALRGMEAAAARIAAGDWGARVGDGLPAYARPMGRAFDRMAGEVERHIAARRRMMQVVSHELRTPLTRMQFGLDLLADAASDAEREAQAEALHADIEGLDGLVDELQAFVRLDRTSPPTRAPFDLAAALDDVIAATRADAATFTRHPLPADSPPIVADRRLFVRAIGNLTRNATRHAAGEIHLAATRGPDGWQVIVDDDGPGIAEADRVRAWQPFVRLEPGAGPGSGLGLAIVQRIVRDHGGAVAIEAAPAGGARLRTTWPDATV